MEILICIDDTDNLDSPGTGHLAEILRKDIETLFGVITTRITRHQLFVSREIPYTSHNSAMCFTADFDIHRIREMIEHAGIFLKEKSAQGSDPGLCVAVTEHIVDRQKLINFGIDATKKVLTKNDAIILSGELKIHLSEYGGTGGGIIGALAGIGLRLGGNNGRFKGWIPVEETDRRTTADRLRAQYPIDEVRSVGGSIISDAEMILLKDKVKTVLLDGKSVLPVKRILSDNEAIWENLSKEEIRKY